VSSRIKEMDRVARDLFREWEKEIAEISTPSLAADSRMKLSATRQRFQTLSTNLHAAESSMTPVLRQFHDQVLYLKHNLNAAAIGSLRTNADGIQADIQSLLVRLDQSMREADAFIGTLK
jgi:flagellar basal body rod protein FlgC